MLRLEDRPQLVRPATVAVSSRASFSCACRVKGRSRAFGCALGTCRVRLVRSRHRRLPPSPDSSRPLRPRIDFFDAHARARRLSPACAGNSRFVPVSLSVRRRGPDCLLRYMAHACVQCGRGDKWGLISLTAGRGWLRELEERPSHAQPVQLPTRFKTHSCRMCTGARSISGLA